VALAALQVRLLLLDLWNLITPEESVGCQKTKLADWLDSLICTTVLQLMDLSSKLILLLLVLLDPHEVVFASLFCHLVELGLLAVTDAMGPLGLDQLLDRTRGQVRHLLLNRVEHFVLKQSLGAQRFLRDLQSLDLCLEALDLFVYGRVVLVTTDAAHRCQVKELGEARGLTSHFLQTW